MIIIDSIIVSILFCWLQSHMCNPSNYCKKAKTHHMFTNPNGIKKWSSSIIKPYGLCWSIFGCLNESSCWVNPVGMGYDAGDFWPWSWRRLKGPGVFLRSTVTNGLVVGGWVSKRSFSTQKIIKKSSVRPSPRKLKLIFATFAWLNLEEDDLTEASMCCCRCKRPLGLSP